MAGKHPGPGDETSWNDVPALIGSPPFIIGQAQALRLLHRYEAMKEQRAALSAALRDILIDWDSPGFRTYYIDEAHIEAARAALALGDTHPAGGT